MGIVTCDMTVSVDGYSGGPKDLDDGFMRIMAWVHQARTFQERFGEPTTPDYTVDDRILAEVTDHTGAYVMGRTMFDSGEIPWGEEPPFHAPVFVVTSRPREPLHRIGTTFHFVTDGVDKAVALAKEAAADRNVAISGGARTVQQALRLGLLDQLQLHIAPVLLGTGMRLLQDTGEDQLELEPNRVVASPQVTHIRYAVRSTR